MLGWDVVSCRFGLVSAALLFVAFAPDAPAQTRSSKPDLSGLTLEEQRAVDGACSLEKTVRGPAAYYQCLRSQLAALSRGPSKPDLSGLTPEERRAVDGACSLEKTVRGPAAYYQCLRSQLAALSRGPSKPDLSGLTLEERRAVDGACSLEKTVRGPAAYYQCLRSQLAALSRGPSKPDLSGLTPEERRAVDGACSLEKTVRGPAAYYQCLRDQLTALNEPIREVQPTLPTPAPRTAPPPRATFARPKAPQPAFKWPDWSTGIPGTPPKTLTGALEPAELFRKVSSSVYVVVAGPSRELLSRSNASQGSAVAVTDQTLVTNCHVLESAGFIAILQEEIVAEAKLVKGDPDTDRCVLQVHSGGLSPVPGVRRFNDIAVGERVYSIGTPSGLEQTLGEGLISGLRERDGVKFIQTSAPISPGSSGGGLFDRHGNLVGVTTFMLKEAQALNFAIAAEEYWQ